MIRFIKEEKKHAFVFAILVLVLGFLMLNGLRLPLLADYAYCSDGRCTCSCSGTSCRCSSYDNTCSCYCVVGNDESCNKSIFPSPDPEPDN